jgi:hypothetical protein
MTVTLIDGFDVHLRIPRGLDIGSTQDIAGHWGASGTIIRYSYPEGFLKGGSVDVGSTLFAHMGGPLAGQTAGRVGAWIKGKVNPQTNFKILQLGSRYSFWVLVGGRVEIRNDNVPIWDSGLSMWTSDWTHWEFYVTNSGRIEVRFMGQLLVALNTTAQTGAVYCEWGSRPYSIIREDIGLVIDHVYITDGPPLTDGPVKAVAVTAAYDRWSGNFPGICGSLVVNGVQQHTAFEWVLISSNASYSGGWNMANVKNFMFPVDPSTGMPWTQAGFDAISSWGICYDGRDPFPRVTAVTLSVLRDVGLAGPIVESLAPTGATSFSGVWDRTDPTRSLAAHVNKAPRQEEGTAEATAIFPKTAGCILFNAHPTSPISEKIGLTFAGEYRRDYRDWALVDGSGIYFHSEFIGGYGVFGEANKKFQDNYVNVNYENVLGGQAYIQGLWDYAEDPDTGRWSNRQRLGSESDKYKHVSRRFKIRGHGKALSIRVTSVPGAPFVINGWTSLVTSNQSP